MNKKALQLLVFVTLLVPCKIFAQENQFSGWAALFHTQRFSPKWGASFDAQFRSANHYSYLRNVLLRPSVNYYFDNTHIGALGYAYIATNGRTATGAETFRPESRIWEQFIINTKIGKTSTLQHRFRLEQRFLGNSSATATDSYFTQRLRYFARAIFPLNRDSVFTQGPFFALQDEIFANVQNKDKVNRNVFDQNRAYAAFGYRLSKKVDAEFGYLNQYQKLTSTSVMNHILQVAFYTRF